MTTSATRARRSGVSKLFDDQMIAVRDYLNEGGKVLVTGQRALQGAWSELLVQPTRALPGPTAAVPARTRARAARSASSRTACTVSDDFLQYWMGAFSRANAGVGHVSGERSNARRAAAVQHRRSRSPGQAFLPRFTHQRRRHFPQFASEATHLVSGNAVGVSTADTLLWGFGLENIADAHDAGDADPRGPRAPRRLRGEPSRVRLRRLAAGTDARPAGDLRNVHARRGARVHGVDDGERDLLPGSATLAVSAPGRLSNGAHMLREPLQVEFAPGPVSNATVGIAFRQRIGASEAAAHRDLQQDAHVHVEQTSRAPRSR